MNNLLNKIKETESSFTKTEIKISQYIIEHIEDGALNTTKEIAQSCNTSEAALSRFAKKIGYKTFKLLKVELIKYTRNVISTSQRIADTVKKVRSDEDIFFSNFIDNQLELIVSIKDIVKSKVFKNLINDIYKSNTIFLFSDEGAISTAVENLNFWLSRIGYTVKIISNNPHRIFDSIIHHRLNDLIISFGIQNSDNLKKLVDFSKSRIPHYIISDSIASLYQPSTTITLKRGLHHQFHSMSQIIILCECIILKLNSICDDKKQKELDELRSFYGI